MSLGFAPEDVPMHQYLALLEHHDTSLGVAMTAAAFADEEDT